MPIGITSLSVRDKSRIREIFANALAAIIGGKQAVSLSGSQQD